MIPIIIFLLSIALQVTAAVFALSLIRTTGRKLAWILIALAMVLMASRRMVSFFSILNTGKEITLETPELIALAISILMLAGVLRIRKYFGSIHRAEEEIRLLQTLTHAISEAKDFNSALSAALKQACEITGWDTAEAWIPSSDRAVLEYTTEGYTTHNGAVTKFINSSKEFTFLPGVGLPGRVWALKHTVWIKDVTQDPNFPRAKIARVAGIKAALGVPVLADDEVVAVLVFFLFRQRDEDERFVNIISAVTAQLGGMFQRKRAEEKLRTSEQRFRSLIENASDYVSLFDCDGIIRYASTSVKHILGYSPDELIGKSAFELVHPDDSQAAIEMFNRGLQHPETTIVLEVRLRHRNGSWRFIEATGRSLLDDPAVEAFVVNSRDVTERKQAEKAVIESEARYRTLVETSPYSIVLADPNGRITFCNQQTLRSHGFSSMKEVLETNCFELFAPECRQRAIDAAQQTLINGGFRNVEYTLIRQDGSRFPAEASASLIVDAEGKPQGFVGILWDITERRRLEEQLRHAQKMQAIGQLAGGIAHEFNNILTAIKGYGSILHTKMKEDDPLRHGVEQILASSERATNLIHGLLSYSRKQISTLRPVDLNDLVRRTEELLLKVIGEDIEIKTVLTDEDLTIMVDISQIEQVLINLATNARDAMPEGGLLAIKTRKVGGSELRVLIEEEAVSEQITQNFELNKDFAEISVADSGMGIDRETKERIFEPFFTTKEVGKGTGLGLSVVYGIIKQHGGYINCYSETGKGATFKIYFPLSYVDSKMMSKEIYTKSEIDSTNPIKVGAETVLVAEDDKILRKLIKTVLSEAGYRVIDAVDGKDAVEKFMENKDGIDFLILDVIMPRKNGREAYDEIKRMRPDIKALFTSGYPSDIIHKKGILEEGINFIFKPVSPKELLRKVREVLDK